MNMKIPVPHDFSFQETVFAHGWRRLLPFRWEEETQALTHTEDLGNGLAVDLHLTAGSGCVEVDTGGGDWEVLRRAEITRRVRRMLQLDLPLEEFHAYCLSRPELAHIVDCKRGRMLRGSTLFEDAVKVIATSNTTWAQTIAMTARLVGAFGTEGRTFPTPPQIAAVPFEEFAAKARMGYRAASVYAIATAITNGALDLEAWQDSDLAADDLRKRLLSLPGIGPYGAACLMLYLGKPAHVNADSVARALLSQELGRPVTDKEVLAFFEAHGQWRGLVYNFYPWKQE